LRSGTASAKELKSIDMASAISSLLAPFALGAAVGGIASGRVPVGNLAGDPVDSWLNPTGVLIGVLAVLTGAYLAAVFLAGDSVRAGLPDLARAFRARALGAAVVTGVIAFAGLFVLRSDARDLFDGLTSGGGLVAVLLSAAAGALTLWLVVSERYGLARLTSAAAVAMVAVGWVLAQDPYVLPPRLTLEQAAAPDATLASVLIGIGLGALVLVPSLWYLYRLVLQGRLDQEYEPLHQRFMPIPADDDRGTAP
jgi:cytochrome d ubiquinol oxidase subunit II